MTTIHPAALEGYSSEAQTYARGRPEYPAALLRWLTEVLDVGPGKVVVDLGAGTGKFTKLLAQTGADVIAVEPVAAMRTQLVNALPAVRCLAGSAEAIPLETSSADALVCAQAFHWFANTPALSEIHRVLNANGMLGLVWNVRDESTDWVAEITRIITPYEGDAPRFHKGDWRTPFSGGKFTALECASFAHQHVGTPQEVILDRILSVSFIAALPAHEKAGVAARLRELIASHPALRGRDTIAFPYRTEAYRCRSCSITT
jgi:SAM-dependent methyltransferase